MDSHKSLDFGNSAVRADFALRGIVKIVGIVVGKSCFEDSIDEGLVRRTKLARAGFNSNNIEVEFSWDDVNANILDNPVAIVSGNNLELGVGIAVSDIGRSESCVLATIVVVLDSMQSFLCPAIGQIVEILSYRNCAIEVDNIVLILASL